MSRAKKTISDLPDDVSQLRGWRRARRSIDPAKAKLPATRITINLDADIIAIFKAEALRGGPPYQVAINQALREFLRERERSDVERAAEIVLKALDDEVVIERLRRIH